MHRSHLLLVLSSLLLGAGGMLWFLSRPASLPEDAPEPQPQRPRIVAPPERSLGPELLEKPADTPEDPVEALENSGLRGTGESPEALMEKIEAAYQSGDLAAMETLIGEDLFDAETRARLQAAAPVPGLSEPRTDVLREVGELEVNARRRWALWLDSEDGERQRWYFDLVRENGRWVVESLKPAEDVIASAEARGRLDALGVVDAFLQSVLRQDFDNARRFVEADAVSDAKIAGLCILFEEGHYALRERKPLRALFLRETMAGFLGTVVSEDEAQSAELTVKLAREDAATTWRIEEINLDQLLLDYARRVGGGDVYFTPLLPNPKGGDTLVLYFAFDEDELTPRTRRQLEIVADVLRGDRGKQLTISGHTDALGSEDYNQALSARRAEAVKRFLVECGVAEEQVRTVAQGPRRPRRPNFTRDGEDNPEGRRVNRRSEIYLDF